jgi:hypothetical protein
MATKNEIRQRIFNNLLTSWKAQNFKGFARISVGSGRNL